MPWKTTTARQRAEAGKALRERVPRTSHAEWTPAPDRPDPIALLDDIAARRLKFLVPLRNARMADTPFTFFRGSAAIMAGDLAPTPISGLHVQACGDAHCLNFGGFATAERNQIFDLNDFDETLPGPWEWDVKRLVTSFILAGREHGLRERDARLAALVAVRSYRTRLRELAALPALDVWYTRLDARQILSEARTAAQRRHGRRVADEAATESIHAAFGKLTEVVDGAPRFREDPPLLFHSAETDRHGFDVEHILGEYAATLSFDVRRLFERYRLVDHAIKVVGVGSVGTRCAVALLLADDHDPLLLQVKEAVPSVLEPFMGASEFANAGERVVRGQRLMQAASDTFLGWAASGDHTFYVRQFKDMKASANLEGADAAEIREYARYCAWALAAAHARSGDAAGIAGYMGTGDTFDRALLTFALTYAEQSQKDHARFTAAIADGEVATT